MQERNALAALQERVKANKKLLRKIRDLTVIIQNTRCSPPSAHRLRHVLAHPQVTSDSFEVGRHMAVFEIAVYHARQPGDS